MGFSAFVQSQKETFLRDFDTKQIPRDMARFDQEKLREWIWDQFQDWFDENRDELLAQEYCRRGWAKMTLAPDPSGQLANTCRVYPECKSEIDAWMRDEIE